MNRRFAANGVREESFIGLRITPDEVVCSIAAPNNTSTIIGIHRLQWPVPSIL